MACWGLGFEELNNEILFDISCKFPPFMVFIILETWNSLMKRNADIHVRQAERVFFYENITPKGGSPSGGECPERSTFFAQVVGKRLAMIKCSE